MEMGIIFLDQQLAALFNLKKMVRKLIFSEQEKMKATHAPNSAA